MKCEKFVLEKALSGEPVILRNGAKAYVRHREEEFKVMYPLMGVVLGEERWETWKLDGSVYADGGDDGYDIIGMYPKESLSMPDRFWEAAHLKISAIVKDKEGRWSAYSYEPAFQNEDGTWEDKYLVGTYTLSSFNPEMFPSKN